MPADSQLHEMPTGAHDEESASLSGVGLTVSFGGVRACRGIDITLRPGQVVGLVGPNGAGKTTLFNLLSGHLVPDRGAVYFEGRDVTKEPEHARARAGLGRSFQEGRLFTGMTALENVFVYGCPVSSSRLWRTFFVPMGEARVRSQARVNALEVMEYFGIVHLRDRLVESLSYAESKIVGMARLLSLGAKVLLLDEPTSGVDDNGRDLVCEKIALLARDGYTVCIVEHNLDVVRRLCEKIVFVADGRVIASGSADAVLSRQDVAEIYFGFDE
jgi:branched-chain amino acid transport system permease protein